MTFLDDIKNPLIERLKGQTDKKRVSFSEQEQNRTILIDSNNNAMLNKTLNELSNFTKLFMFAYWLLLFKLLFALRLC
jgi:hypothetical protein